MPSTRRLVLIGLSYRTAALALRERLGCSLANLPDGWRNKDGRFAAVQELVVLSTCNRVELVAVLNCPGLDARSLLAALLAVMTGVDTVVFADHLYFFTGIEAAEHLCRVASGLDSQVLGEPQILGQVSEAFQAATAAKTSGPVLTQLGRTAVRCGKRARSETGISQNPVSTSAMAVAQAQAVLGDLTSRQHLIVGAGEMGHLALKALIARGVYAAAIANRSRARAQALAEPHGLRVYGFDELSEATAGADVVICATSSRKPILTKTMVKAAMSRRPARPLVIIDIAVPRDVESTVNSLKNVHLFDADHLQQSLDEALATRRREIPATETIIMAEIEGFKNALRELAVRPVLVDLRHKAEAIRQHELERTMRYLGDLDPGALEHIQHFSHALVNKLLHEPTLRLRDEAVHENAAVYANTVRDLFGLYKADSDE